MFRLFVTVLCGACQLAIAPIAHAQTAAPPPQPGVLAGQMEVTGPTWSFQSTLADVSGPWASATVTNTNCTTPYLPGSAQAGAVIFTTPLTPATTSGVLEPFRGSAATGQITLAPMADRGGTTVTASLSGLEPFVQGTTLSVCLSVMLRPSVLADIDVGQQRVAATNFDVTGVSTTSGDTHQHVLIAISGTQTTSDGVNHQMVFFFVGDTFLGTDTALPSLAPLQLMGSPGADQLDVMYEDPAGGSPVTITYTLADGALTPSGTPPGH